jgi:alginate O-acetyltransferase complex protein AlgI
VIAIAPGAPAARVMLFNSLIFIFVFLPSLLLLYYLARKSVSHEAALFVLTLGSLVFYSYWNIYNLPILLGSAVANYLIGLAIVRWRIKAIVIAGIAANLILLGVFKYMHFFSVVATSISGHDMTAPEREIPLGISFFTFQQISFLVDIWTRRTETTGVMKHVLFVTFFPHLIAGPIVQHHQIVHQFADKRRKDDIWANLGTGLSIFAVGLSKKVLIADNLEVFAASAFGSAAAGHVPGFGDAWLSAVAYALQIFFDFSGYSDMAIGLARCFGYNLPINFNAPYRSVSIVEFWRRWHISLSQFLKNHLYIPLGGNRHGQPRRYFNLMVTMLLGGLWHGAGWTFVVWGGLHGLMLSAAHLWEKAKLPSPSVALGKRTMIVVTFLAVTFAWVFFRAPTFAAATRVFEGMVGLGGLRTIPDLAGVALVVFALTLVWGLPDTAQIFYDELDPEMIDTASVAPPAPRAPRWRPIAPMAVTASLLLFVCVLNASKVTPFIYFQF